MQKNSLNYKEVNKFLIKQIKNGSINEKTILNSTNYINAQERSANGIFYTPKKITDNAYLYLDKALPKNWKETFIVWDCASGKNNLTKDLNHGKSRKDRSETCK